MSDSPGPSSAAVGAVVLSVLATFAVGVLFLLPLEDAGADTTVSFSHLDGVTEEFNCNAGNAGYGRDPRSARTVNDLARAMETRSNSSEASTLRMLAIRIQDGRVVAREESADRRFRPGQEIPSFSEDAGTPGFWTIKAMASALRVDPEARLAEEGLRYVREHVPVRSVMEASRGGRAEDLLRLVGASGLRDRDVILLVPVPTNWERLEAFTVHPTVVVLH